MAKRQQERYTADKMIEALRKARGIAARAAEMLGCDRQTVLNYCKKYPTVQAAREEAKETLNDWVESQMIKRIQAGDTTMMIWWSKTQMKDRNFVERIDNRNYDIDLSKLTNDQLERVAAGEDPLQVVLDGYVATNKSSG
jgi:hypothetical protein